jgi:hypothetical protein
MPRISFEYRITLGNVLTIVGGVFVALSLAATIGVAYSELKSDMRDVKTDVADMKCSMVSAGWIATSTPCSLPRRAFNQ